MEEFVLDNVSDATFLSNFSDFCRTAGNLGATSVGLRIRLVDAFLPTAWYWHDVLRGSPFHGLTMPGVVATLDGVSCLAAMIIWCGAVSRRVTDTTTVSTQSHFRSGSSDFEKTVRALAAPMTFTEQEECEGFRQKTVAEWLTQPRILTPGVLRRHYWMPPDNSPYPLLR